MGPLSRVTGYLAKVSCHEDHRWRGDEMPEVRGGKDDRYELEDQKLWKKEDRSAGLSNESLHESIYILYPAVGIDAQPAFQ